MAPPGSDEQRPATGVVHGLRLTGAGLLAGVVAGAVAGLGSRVAMYVVRLVNPSYHGVITHASSEVGRVTVAGTLSLALEGALLYGLSGGVVYLLVRRWMPGRGWLKGLAFGCFLLVAAPVVLDGSNYEYFRYVPTWASVGLFSLLYPLYGVVVAPLTERLGRGAQGRPRHAAVAWAGYLVLAGVVAWSLPRDYRLLRDVFHVFG